jgi:hypothetical protein
MNDSDYRIILWRSAGNRLDLIEQSLVYKLNGNAKSIYFTNSIIPRPFIQSNGTFLEILVTTTSSFYKFRIPLANVISYFYYCFVTKIGYLFHFN